MSFTPIFNNDGTLTDVTNLNASTSAHGLLRKLDGNTSHFLRGDGTWAAPAGGGGGSNTVTISVSAAQIGTYERVIGSIRLASGSTVRATSRALIGGSQSAYGAILRMRRNANGALLASFTASTTALASIALDGGADVSVSATDWYDLTLAAAGASQTALCTGATIEL